MQQKLISHVSDGWESKNKVPADSASVEHLLLVPETALLTLCPHVAEGKRELWGVSFAKALIPFLRALMSWPNCLSRLHLWLSSHGEVSFNIFWGEGIQPPHRLPRHTGGQRARMVGERAHAGQPPNTHVVERNGD